MDLYSIDPTDFATLASLWTVNSPASNSAPRVSYCGSVILMGGIGLIGSSTVLQITYTSLPTHQYISYMLKGVNINQWPSSGRIVLKIDNTNIVTLYPQSDTVGSPQGDCGNPGKDFLQYDIVGVRPHTTTSLTIQYTVTNSDYASASYGLHNLSVLLRPISVGFTEVCKAFPTTYSASCNPNSSVYKDDFSPHAAHPCDPACDSCFGAGPDHCFGCRIGYFFNGAICLKCDPSCALCNGTNANQCTHCFPGYYLQQDNYTCTTSCNLPFNIQGAGAYKICSSPCNSTQPFYQIDNATCIATCYPPYVRISFGSMTFCSSPCISGRYFQTDNSTCTTACYSPYVQISFGPQPLILCSPPCSSTQYFQTDNHTCTAACDQPYIKTSLTTTCKTCSPPCSSAQYFQTDNHTCTAVCNQPYIKTSLTTACKTCSAPCASGNYFQTDNSTCTAGCYSLYAKILFGSIVLCSPPCSSEYYFQADNSTCTLTCYSPYNKQSLTTTFKICSSPCKANQYIYYNFPTAQIKCWQNCSSPYKILNKIYCSPCDEYENIAYNKLTGNVSCSKSCKYPYEFVNSTYCILRSDNNNQTKSGIASIIQKTRISNVIISRILLLTSSESSGLLLWGCVADMLQYARYVDINYTEKLRFIFNTNTIIEIIEGYLPSLNNIVTSKFTTSPLPQRFKDYGVQSSF